MPLKEALINVFDSNYKEHTGVHYLETNYYLSHPSIP